MTGSLLDDDGQLLHEGQILAAALERPDDATLIKAGRSPWKGRKGYSSAPFVEEQKIRTAQTVLTFLVLWHPDMGAEVLILPYAVTGFLLLIRYWKTMTATTTARPAISVQVEGASSSRPPAMARIRVYQGMGL